MLCAAKWQPASCRLGVESGALSKVGCAAPSRRALDLARFLDLRLLTELFYPFASDRGGDLRCTAEREKDRNLANDAASSQRREGEWLTYPVSTA
jgi:hypothetical protein